MDPLQELYRQKGEAQTQIEIWTGKLQSINQEIAKVIGRGISPPPREQEPEKKE